MPGVSVAAGAPYSNPEVWDRFDDSPNGAPEAARAGGAWALWGGTVGATAEPTVVSGKLTSAIPGTVAAGYASLPLRYSGRRVGAKFVFGAYSTNMGAAVIGLFGASIEATWPTIPDSPCHLVISPVDWIYGVYSGDVFTQVATGQFATALAADGVTEHSCEVNLDQASDTAYITLPDGSVRAITHALIGSVVGNWAFWEYYRSATTDSLAAFTDVWSDSLRADALPTARRLSLIPGVPASVDYAPATNADVAVPDAEATVDATNLAATVWIPPGCTALLVEMDGILVMSGSTRVFWSIREGATTYGTRNVVSQQYSGALHSSVKITGLAPGSAHTYVWRHWAIAAGVATLKLDSPNGYSAVMKFTPLAA